MMVIEFKYQSVSDLILFIHVSIKAEYPYVEYKDSDTAPSGEIPCKSTVFFQRDIFNDDNYDQ
jgi:hypothetical protein